MFQRAFSLTRVSFGTRSGHLCGWRSFIALRRKRVARHSRHLSKSLQSAGNNPSVKIPPPTCNSSGVNGSAFHPLSKGRNSHWTMYRLFSRDPAVVVWPGYAHSTWPTVWPRPWSSGSRGGFHPVTHSGTSY